MILYPNFIKKKTNKLAATCTKPQHNIVAFIGYKGDHNTSEFIVGYCKKNLVSILAVNQKEKMDYKSLCIEWSLTRKTY